MKDLFTLIQKEDVEIDVRRKILKAEEFSQVLGIEELLQKAKQEVEVFKQAAQEEMEKEKIRSEQEGFLEGQKKWASQVALLQEHTEKLRAEFEKEMVPLIIQCGKKILGRELETNPKAVVDIVKNALRPIASHKVITLFVHKDDLLILEENKPRLKEILERVESLTLDTRPDITRGGCIIETESGIINATLETLWESLEIALTSLLKRS